jgi:hypothetical protein
MNPYNKFKTIVAYLALIAVATWELQLKAQNNQKQDPLAVTALKRAMGPLPNVEELVVSTRSVASPNLLASLGKQDTHRKDPESFTLVRWVSPDLCYSHSGSSIAELTNEVYAASMGGFGGGVFEGNCWQINGSILTYFKTGGIDSRVVRKGPAATMEALNFGIPFLNHSAVKWEGNHLTGTTTMGQHFSGELECDEFFPVSLLVSIDGNNHSNFVEFNYDGESDYPSSFTAGIMQKTGKKEPIVLTKIYSVKLSVAPLPEALFDPERFLPKGRVRTLIVSNGFGYMKADGRLILAPFKPSRTHFRFGHVQYILLLAVGTFILFLLFRIAFRKPS